VLRQEEWSAAPRTPTPTVDQVDGLISDAERAGVHIDMTISGKARPLTTAVSAASYRIVQESLTNVLRHAQAHNATIALRYEPTGVGIAIADDGIGAPIDVRSDPESHPFSAQSGHGIGGMRERATALGGWLRAGPQLGGGFLVEAWLPTVESRRDDEQPGASEGASS